VSQQLVDAIAFVLIFDILGVVGGMIYGATMSSDGVTLGIMNGLYLANRLAGVGVWGQCLKAAFGHDVKWGLITLFVPCGFFVFCFQEFETRAVYFFKWMIVFFVSICLGIACVVLGFSVNYAGIRTQEPEPVETAPANPGQQMQNPMMMQNPGMPNPGMPNPGMQGQPQVSMPQGAMTPQGAHGGPAPAAPTAPPSQ
jgi:hypothetical protein